MTASVDDPGGAPGGTGRRVRVPEPGVRVIDRPRLTSLLDTADIATLVAPAGYGKTTLLASWARNSNRNVAWLTLTDADLDPVRLLRDLVSALRVSEHGDPPVVDDLVQPSLEADSAVVVAALHAAISRSRDALTFVIDDTDAVADAPGCVQLLNTFTWDGPAQLRVVLAGRRAMPSAMPRRRPGRHLVEIVEADLAFSPAETARAMRAAPAAVQPHRVQDVQASTGGWPVAVQLFVLGARAGQPADMADASHIHDLTRYLVSEVLDRIDPGLRTFILDASIDDTICAALLDTVRGTADSAADLRACHKGGIFLTLEAERTPGVAWYRWHQVFISHVRRVALAEDPVRHRTLHGRAAHWWRSVDTVVAVDHAVRAGRTELAADLAADAWPELVLRGMTETVGNLVRDLPAGLVREAELHLAAAFVEANRGDGTRARHALGRARAVADRLPEADRARFDARAAAVSLLFASTRDTTLQVVVERGRELLRRLENGPWTPDSTTLMLTRLTVGMGEARLQQDSEHALALLRSAGEIAANRQFPAVRLVAMAESCMPLTAMSKLDVAAATAREVCTLASRGGWAPPRALAPATYFHGWYAYWRDELVEARTSLSTVIDLLNGLDPVLVALATYFRGLSLLRAGSAIQAAADLDAVRVLARTGAVAPYLPSLARSFDAELCLARGDRARARRAVGAQAPGPQHQLATTAYARVLTLLEQPVEALAILNHANQSGSAAPIRIETLQIRAVALSQLGEAEQARQVLDDALGIAEPHGILLPFVAGGVELRGLLHDLVDDCAHPQMLAQVLSRISGPEHHAGNRGALLTSRERTILHRLQSDLTLAEIAAVEYISINTMKTHVRSIYRKLGADGRRDAVHAAQELGIV